jgi:glycosyltransferase involved in cell wall biosynthesis
LCRELSNHGCDVSILTLEYAKDDIEDCGKAKIIEYKSNRLRLFEIIKNHDIVNLNGIWPHINNKVIQLCKKYKLKYIVSPHASLMLSDINKSYFKAMKKYAAWQIYIKNNLKHASGFHVTGRNELEDLKRFGFHLPAALLPNGINVQEYREVVEKESLHKLFPKTRDKRVLLFFSRIAPNKGLSLLAHAWGKVVCDHTNWHLLIVGPDNDRYWPEVKSIMDGYDKSNYTRSDYLRGQDRMAVLQHSDLFVLPTYWENFGIVIAESLMAGTPVLTTTKTPWTELEARGCGWTVEPRIEDLEQKLRNAMNLETQTLNQMGQKGREYVSKYFDWRNIAADMKRYYEYILGYREKPEFVYQLQGNGNPSLPIRKPGSLS